MALNKRKPQPYVYSPDRAAKVSETADLVAGLFVAVVTIVTLALALWVIP